MSEYRRVKTPGGCYFFTLVTCKRQPLFTEPKNIHLLQQAIKKTKEKHPFSLTGLVILPDHLHAIWNLPQGDCNYSVRW